LDSERHLLEGEREKESEREREIKNSVIKIIRMERDSKNGGMSCR